MAAHRQTTQFIVIGCTDCRPQDVVSAERPDGHYFIRRCGSATYLNDTRSELPRNFPEGRSPLSGCAIVVILEGGRSVSGEPAGVYSYAQMATLRTLVAGLLTEYPEANVRPISSFDVDMKGPYFEPKDLFSNHMVNNA